MNTIYTNSTNTNILNNNQNTVTSVNNNQTLKGNWNSANINVNNKTDSVEISEKDANKVNKKKAFDAFCEASSEFTDSKDATAKLRIEFSVIGKMMESKGYNVPTFNIDDNTNSVGFLSYLKDMKDFVKNSNIKHKVY